MSGIAKPMILPSAAGFVSGNGVPADDVMSVEAFDNVGDVRGAPQATTYGILFNFRLPSRPREIWYYTTSGTRNTAIGLVRNTIAAVVA